MKKNFANLCFLLLLSFQLVAQNKDFLCVPYKQFGKVLPTHTEADLIRIFGKTNVVRDSFFVEGDFAHLITTVFKGKAEQFSIFWKEENPPFKKPMSVSCDAKKSPFYVFQGIKVGSPITELVKLNDGKAFEFSGFGWDFGGNCCFNLVNNKFDGLSFRLNMLDNNYQKISETDQNKILGDQMVKSDLPIFKKFTPFISEITISLNQYE
ncbi:MAG: hypothetical protein EAZ97_14825 [Bacteroidetes bacterium]|nr:MAG: hypothetical protein EAZ97_14825 [Bacteroidota bacterium]